MEDVVKEAIKNLEEYINIDPFYNGSFEIEMDFERFCYNHCKDIDILLKYVKGEKYE